VGIEECNVGLKGVYSTGGGITNGGGFICIGSLSGCDEYAFCKALGLFSILMTVVVGTECEAGVKN
jgi:hypothetical protein